MATGEHSPASHGEGDELMPAFVVSLLGNLMSCIYFSDAMLVLVSADTVEQ